MRNLRNKSLGAILASIVGIWLLFFIVPVVVCLFYPNLSTIEILGISFSAATALFTGIAFAVAFHSLFKQQESLKAQQDYLKTQQDSLLKQTRAGVLGTFMDSMKIVTNSQSFRQCQDYILSDDFFDDGDRIRQARYKNKGDDIGLDDYSKVLDQGENNKEQWKIDLRKKRDMIKTFCMRMELMGIILSGLEYDRTAEKLIMELYGNTIKKTYRRLGPLIEKTREKPESMDLYKHYTRLNEIAKTYNNI